ncbi:GntR family transcriptional regulator [Inquilinus limosus]|uniref:GntR family transcriptional regulator n=1 Tax=Inquilinus limosus MP06 TaxID=1398085 RepID=A0A0A0D5K0_9PROT|nr:GntR family transcriptional regulator [Inquilinus limosus]KGM33971.1 GntR family transcriptional regulator [Inquilinus limosus MP06]
MELDLQDALADSPGGPIARPSLHDQIVGRIRDMVIEGVLPPGARIHEGQLGAQLGVSRTPLREALKYLASEGLLDLVPGRGAVVKRFSAKEVQDMLAVLGLLEAEAGRLACADAADAGIREVRALHDRMLEHYRRRERLEYFKLNQAIHSAILHLSGNAALVTVHGILQSRLKRIRFIGNGSEEKWAAAVADHEEMIAALEARDPERLAAILSAHMRESWNRVREAI